MKIKEINALISLLEDPDHEIYAQVKGKLIEFGLKSIPYLEKAWELNFDSLVQVRSEQIIQEILFKKSKKDLSDWLESNKKDLFDGWLIITKYRYPDLDVEQIKKDLDDIQKKVSSELDQPLKSIQVVMKFNKVLFKYEKFRGNFKNYHSPKNSFINDVLNLKKGNPLSLSLIYIIIAQRLGIPIKGVNLPKHFILAFTSEDLTNIDPVEFYINPFSLGAIIDRKDVEHFLKKENIPLNSEYFDVCSHKMILKRLINNLLNSYTRKGNKNEVDKMLELLDLFN
ncbi:MAG: transglutaminase family protein [Flavobacteriales bacterium]